MDIRLGRQQKEPKTERLLLIEWLQNQFARKQLCHIRLTTRYQKKKKNQTYIKPELAFQGHRNPSNRDHQMVSLCCLPMTQLSS